MSEPLTVAQRSDIRSFNLASQSYAKFPRLPNENRQLLRQENFRGVKLTPFPAQIVHCAVEIG